MKSPKGNIPEFFIPSKKSFGFQVIKEPIPFINPNQPPRILKCLWKIGNCLLIIPARKESEPSRSRWLQIIHKIMCGLTSFISIALMTTMMFASARKYVGHLTDDPVGIFICAELVTFLVIITTVYLGSWRLGSKLAGLLKLELPQTRLDFWGWTLATLLHTLSRLSEVVEIMFFSPPNEELFHKFRVRFEANMFFFLRPETRNQLWNPYLNFFCTLSYTSTKFARIFGTILVFAGITLHGSVVRKFCACVQKNVSLSEFRSHYATMQHQINEVNNLVKPFLLGLTLHIFPMYMMWSTDLFENSHKDSKIRDKIGFINDFALYAIFFGMAAYNYQKVVRRMEEIVLLNGMVWNIDAVEFTSFLHRSRHSELGVSGGGLFTITHKSIASVLSLMLTYTIVLIQFKSSRGVAENSP